jgi:hypothetical protein
MRCISKWEESKDSMNLKNVLMCVQVVKLYCCFELHVHKGIQILVTLILTINKLKH